MRRPRSNRSAQSWPFWLLLAAWFCANAPQAAVTSVCSWLLEARRFSHQVRLSADVAYLLAGQEREEELSARGDGHEAPKPALPSADAGVKIDLAVESDATLSLAPRSPLAILIRESCPREGPTCRPPHEPPRSGA